MVCAQSQVFKYLQSIPSPQQYRCTQGDFKIIKPNSLLKKQKNILDLLYITLIIQSTKDK